MTEESQQTYQNKSFKLVFILVFLIIVLVLSSFLALQKTTIFSRATSVNNSPVVMENSYLLASPLQAKADGQEKIRITAFILDGRGMGVGNLPTTLHLDKNIVINPTQPYTDETGKAIFDIQSSTPGSYYIEASANGKTIPQKIKVIYY